MTRIDFYVLGEQSRQSPERLVCTLAGKAFASGRKVYIHGSNEQQLRQLDELLWTFRDVSFLPHGLFEEAAPELPVLLGCGGQQPPGHHEVLINQSDEVPEFFSSFERLLEIVGGDREQRRQARERFRFYRDRGYPLNTHEV